MWQGLRGICAFIIAAVLSPRGSLPRTYVHYTPDELVVTSKNQVKRMPNPYRVYRLEKGGVAATNQTLPHYELHHLPKTGLPIFRSKADPEAKVRLIFLPGSGADISTVSALLKVIQMFEHLGAERRPRKAIACALFGNRWPTRFCLTR